MHESNGGAKLTTTVTATSTTSTTLTTITTTIRECGPGNHLDFVCIPLATNADLHAPNTQGNAGRVCLRLLPEFFDSPYFGIEPHVICTP